MSTQINNGGPAFPVPVQDDRDCFGRFASGYAGMTLRDYFAGQALAGILGGRKIEIHHMCTDGFSARAYEWADAMLRARNGGQK